MKQRWIYLLTALTLAVGAYAAKPMTSGAASPDLAHDCYITIYPESANKPEGQTAFGADLDGTGKDSAQVAVDVYKVADAVKTPGYNTYSYRFTGAYENLDIPSEPKAADWKALAQEAAEIALLGIGDTQLTIESVDASADRQKMALAADENDTASGLYLLIARGRGLTDTEDYEIHMGNAEGDIATTANSGQYTYIFSPELISIPMRGENGTADVTGPSPEYENGPLPEGMTGDYQYTTADSGEWVYDLNVYLKPVRVRRYGSLEITKKLKIYETEEEVSAPASGGTGQGGKVTFVFKASWTDPDDGDKTSSAIESLTFDGTGEKKIRIDRIPVGTDVTVEEIYSGAGYDEENPLPQPQTVQIKAEDVKNGIALLDDDKRVRTIISGNASGSGTQEPPVIAIDASVSFTDVYNWEQKKGYGIKNQFTYVDNGDWVWTSDDPDQTDNNKTVHNQAVSRAGAGQTP